MSKPVILFRFHRDFEVCAERIKTLRALNPGMPIYGLYGGPETRAAEAHAVLGPLLRDLRAGLARAPEWKWRHPDLDLKNWYRTFGKGLDFDRLYDYEWDLLTAAPLEEIYPRVDDKTIALCAVTAFAPSVEAQWYWTSHVEERPRFLEFMRYMNGKYGLASLEHASLGPGPLLTRKFLEAFSSTEDNDWVLSEISYPAYAQALGFKLINNNLLEGLNRPDLSRFFNCEEKPIDFDVITAQMAQPQGRRAFHPVKYRVTLEQLLGTQLMQASGS